MRFSRQGIKLAAMSYDNPAILKEFSARFHVEYPLLSDPHSELLRRLGVLDPDNGPNNVPEYAKKNMAYPGFIYLDNQGRVKEKFFGGTYFDRYTANNIIGKLFPELLEGEGTTLKTPQLEVVLKQSDHDATLGSRVTLIAEIKLPQGMHVYAPEVKTYKPIQLVIESLELVRLKDARYPRAETMFLPAIKERVPVYRSRFRIVQDVMIMPTRKLQESLNALGASRENGVTLTIRGRLRYQACDAKTCFLPAELLLSWDLRVHQPDDKRASEPIQDRPN
jgi:hypothetical protein